MTQSTGGTGFQDQMAAIAAWFGSWSECEQTVALSALARKLPLSQARFMQHVLSQAVTIAAFDKPDFERLEARANDSGFVRGLCHESKDAAVRQLLVSLPLLRPDNSEAKKEYLAIVRLVLFHSLDNRCHLEETRQLLSYLLIHPALHADERAQFTSWLARVEAHYSGAPSADAFSASHRRSASSSDALLGGGGGGFADGTVTVTSSLATAFDQHASLTLTSSSPSMLTAASLSYGDMQQQPVWLHRDSGVGSELGEFALFDSSGSSSMYGGLQTVTGAQCGGPAGGSEEGLRGSLSGLGSELKQREHLPLQSSRSGPASLADLTVAAATWDRSSAQLGVPNGHKKLARTPSLAVKTTTAAEAASPVMDWLHYEQPPSMPTLTVNTKMAAMAVDSTGPLSPQGSVSSSGSGGSDGHNDDVTTSHGTANDPTGMKEVTTWLKTLRLHKYAGLFQSLTYDEMININEDWLEAQGVTKGARNKLILSIQKLRERSSVLHQLEKNLTSLAGIKYALSEIQSILGSPIRAYQMRDKLSKRQHPSLATADSGGGGDMGQRGAGVTGGGQMGEHLSPSSLSYASSLDADTAVADDDIPGHITRIMGKICSQLLVSVRSDDDLYTTYLQVLDRCLLHGAFSHEHRRKLSSWRQQVIVANPQRFNAGIQRRGHALLSHGPLRATTSQRTARGQSPMSTLGQPKWSFGGSGSSKPLLSNHALPLGPSSSNSGLGFASHGVPSMNDHALVIGRPDLLDLPCKMPLTLSRSAPPNTNNASMSELSGIVSELELTARLDDLCLSMTEHALSGGLDSPGDHN